MVKWKCGTARRFLSGYKLVQDPRHELASFESHLSMGRSLRSLKDWFYCGGIREYGFTPFLFKRLQMFGFSVNTGIILQFSIGMELQSQGLKEVNDSHFHPIFHPVVCNTLKFPENAK